MAKAKRIVPERCCGAIIDVQPFFLGQLDRRPRSRMVTNIGNFARLLGHFRIPIVVTIEQPVARKGELPAAIAKRLAGDVRVFEKDFFDLCKEKKIRDHLARLKRKQFVLAGCETDVCILQSCLGLLDLGYEVYLVEELLFSSTSNVHAAIARMAAAGATFLSYKTLFYELCASVDRSGDAEEQLDAFGPFPGDLPDSAV
jgi:nicotinamidase-related amidase